MTSLELIIWFSVMHYVGLIFVIVEYVCLQFEARFYNSTPSSMKFTDFQKYINYLTEI